MSDRIFTKTGLVALALSLVSVPIAEADQLLAAWEFNVADVSGESVSATAGSAANTTGLLKADAAVKGGVLTLDGNGDYLEFGDDLDELREQDSLTIAAWVKSNSPVGGLRRIVEHEDNTYFWAENDIFQYTTHGTGGGQTGRAQSTTPPEPGVWQHVLVTFSGGGPAKMYVDGELEGESTTDQEPIPGNVHTFQIGARRSSSGAASNFWDGQMDDVAIWDCELPEEDIKALAGVGKGGYPGRRPPVGSGEDCNGDGVPDAWYAQFGLDGCDIATGNADPDGDTLASKREFSLGTNPTKADSDGDALPDNSEVETHLTNPASADSDSDGLTDGEEINTHATDPNLADSDQDGLDDGAEVNTHKTSPIKTDSDNDGFADGAEIAAGTNPLDAMGFPQIAIADGLFLYFSFDTADSVDGTFLDLARHAAGPYDGTAMHGGPAPGAEGIVGEAIEFEGGPNNGEFPYIDLSPHAEAIGALEEGTIAAWTKTPNDGLSTDVLTIFAVSDEFAGSLETRYWISNGGAFGTGTLAYGVRNGGAGAQGSINSGDTNPLLDGEWHHVAVTYTATDETTLLYIDGQEVASGPSGFFADVPEVNTAGIGRNKDSSEGGGQWFFDGIMDDFGLWSRPLLPSEIAFLHDEGRRGNGINPGGVAPFAITDITIGGEPRQVTLIWNSRSGRSYAVEVSEDLETWEELEDSIPAAGDVTTFTGDSVGAEKAAVFFRIREDS